MLDSYPIFTPGFSLGRFLLFPPSNSTKKRPVGAALIHTDAVAMSFTQLYERAQKDVTWYMLSQYRRKY